MSVRERLPVEVARVGGGVEVGMIHCVVKASSATSSSPKGEASLERQTEVLEDGRVRSFGHS
jgi:hypothetical protein